MRACLGILLCESLWERELSLIVKIRLFHLWCVCSLLVLSIFIVGSTGICWRLWLVLSISKWLITRNLLLLIGLLELLLHGGIYRHLQRCFLRHIILLEFMVVLLFKVCTSNDCRFHISRKASWHASIVGCIVHWLRIDAWCVVIIRWHCILR